MRELLKAIKFGLLKHDGQRRKISYETYFVHPIRVAELAELYVNDIDKVAHPNYLLIAILHDTLEDTDTTMYELEDEFGEFVARSVFELTNPPKLAGENRAQYKARINKLLSYRIPLIRTLKLCDRLDNIHSMKVGNTTWIAKYCDETIDLLYSVGGGNSSLYYAIDSAMKTLKKSL